MKSLFFVLCLAAAAAVLPACKQTAKTGSETPQPTTQAPDAPLIGTRWLLRTLDGKPAEPKNARQEPHLVFASGLVLNGSGGCNNLSGSYKVEQDRLTVSNLGSTKMMCPDAMAVEQGFMDALRKTQNFRIKGNTLTLLASGKALATLEAAGQ